jgi:predicted MFS family arabinose efflux permease
MDRPTATDDGVDTSPVFLKGGLLRSIIILGLSRLVINITRRFTYPFIPSIGRALDVPATSIQRVVAAQAAVGVSSPLFGPIVERFGRRRTMLLALLMVSVAAFIGAALPAYNAFFAVMLVFGLGKILFDLSLLAYLGDRVPYRRRAFAIGTTELSWAGALLVSAWAVGLLLELNGIAAVFFAIGFASAAAFVTVWIGVPPDSPKPTTDTPSASPLVLWRTLRQSPSGLSAAGYSLLVAMSNEIFFVNYGLWMEASFGLTLAALGAATTVIALAEVLGEFTVIGLGDVLGKKRLAAAGALISALSYALLPWLNHSLPFALLGLFVMFLAVEVAIVASIPLFTEIMPQARAVMMSSVGGAAASGRLLGALLGGLLYSLTGSFILMGLIATLVGVGAVLLMAYTIAEREG